MSTDKITGVAAGRELFDRLHSRKERPSAPEQGTYTDPMRLAETSPGALWLKQQKAAASEARERETPNRAKAGAPKRGTKGIAAGRALYESEGRWDPADVQTGEEGTEV